MMHHRIYRYNGFTTSNIELVHLLKAWLIISIAFAVVLSNRNFSSQIFYFLFVSAITVGTGFIFHELAHKIVAQRYRCFAEFRADDKMLLFALFLSLAAGFIFAAPGAVMILGHINRKQNGIISMAGPLTNLVLGVIFLALFFAYPVAIFLYGAMINVWLGLFNMIPFGNLDGIKILRWNKLVYAMMLIAGSALMILLY